MLLLDNLKRSSKFGFRAIVRDNRLCDKRVQFLIGNERRPPHELKITQEKLLRKSLEAAKRRIRAYRALNIPRTNVTDYLKTLPLVQKSDLLRRPREFYPSLGVEAFWTPRGKTSGTTGTPLEIFRSISSVIWEYSFIQRHWRWSGFQKHQPRASLRGDDIASLSQTKPPFWYLNRSENQLLVSTRHLRAPYIDKIIEKLEEFRPVILQAYPSAAFELAQYLQQTGRKLDIPFVYTASEMIYPQQRELVTAQFNARIFDFYGMAERVAFASECEFGQYHVNPEYAYVEIVDEDGLPTREEGFIVGTTFHNMSMPLVRYKTSDRARWVDAECACGRTYPTISPIAGKYEDYIYGSSGNRISPSIVTFAFKGLRHIQKSQVAQVGENHWEIRIVPMSGFGDSERRELVENVHALVDSDIHVSVVECVDIPTTSAGKFRWIVNEMQ